MYIYQRVSTEKRIERASESWHEEKLDRNTPFHNAAQCALLFKCSLFPVFLCSAAWVLLFRVTFYLITRDRCAASRRREEQKARSLPDGEKRSHDVPRRERDRDDNFQNSLTKIRGSEEKPGLDALWRG